MKKYLKINNQDYPLSFGSNFKRLMEVEHKFVFSDFRKLINAAPHNVLLSLCFTSLQEGARQAGGKLPFDIADLADFWDNDPTLIEKYMEALTESMTSAEAKN